MYIIAYLLTGILTSGITKFTSTEKEKKEFENFYIVIIFIWPLFWLIIACLWLIDRLKNVIDDVVEAFDKLGKIKIRWK